MHCQALERLAGLLENERASITLTEKGTTDAVPRHANFRLFAAMNPATDAGVTRGMPTLVLSLRLLSRNSV